MRSWKPSCGASAEVSQADPLTSGAEYDPKLQCQAGSIPKSELMLCAASPRTQDFTPLTP
jgi:hypothetical protein